MPARARKQPDDLHRFHHFRGKLGAAGWELPVRFKARIGSDGELELDIHAFRISKKSWFIREHWNNDSSGGVPEFTLSGVTGDGLRFESDSLSLLALGERWSGIHSRHWSKPRGGCAQARFLRSLDRPLDRPLMKLHLKGFDCFPALHAECALGVVHVGGATKFENADELTGVILIQAPEKLQDVHEWRRQCQKLLEHLRRYLSFASATMLHAPVLEVAVADTLEIEVLSQGRQDPPVMRVFHKMDQRGLLEAALASFFEPKIEAKNLFFAIEWFSMPSSYDEVRLVNAMTALENLIDSNLPEDEAVIEPKREFARTRKALRKVIKACLAQWPLPKAELVLEELDERLADLNRRSLRRKLYRLAALWGVPLDGISDEQIRQAIGARNAVVHTGKHPEEADGPDLWARMTIVRELVVRFLLTAMRFRGQYISHFGGYHFAHFPPADEPPASLLPNDRQSGSGDATDGGTASAAENAPGD